MVLTQDVYGNYVQRGEALIDNAVYIPHVTHMLLRRILAKPEYETHVCTHQYVFRK